MVMLLTVMFSISPWSTTSKAKPLLYMKVLLLSEILR